MSRGTPDPAAFLPPSPTGLSPSLAGLSSSVPLASVRLLQSLPRHARAPVWAPPLSLAATRGIEFSFFSSGYLDVSVRRVPPVRLCIHRTVHELSSCGFPHSDICGSSDICSLPQLFAACHVFLRLPVPRASALRPYSLNLSAHSVALPGFVKTSSSFPLYVSLCFRNLICIRFSRNGNGHPPYGLKWTRTTDLTLIRRAL